MGSTWTKISNGVFSALAGVAAFIFTLLGFLLLGDIDQQVVASLFIGLFALLVVRLAAERPKSGHVRAVTALIERLLAVHRGDLASPAPQAVHEEMPALATAVDGLFEQVRSSLDNFQTMAMYDPVTSLPNRIHFRREADRILAARHPEDVTALLFIDLDGFKEVNDRLGHAQGDQVLTMVANRLRVVVKAEAESGAASEPLLARLAGDEFTLLLPAVAGRDEAERIAWRALAAIAEPFRIVGQPGQMGASIGIALCPDHASDLTALMKAADIAMYHAKGSGRARVSVYDPELARASEQRAALESELRKAVEGGEFELVYEPRLCLRSGAILAGHALVRWNRPAEGPVLVESLNGIAREAGLSDALADWTLTAAGGALARWHDLDLPQRLCFSLSAAELDRGIAGRLRLALASAPPPPWNLEVEIDGDAVADCKPHVRAELETLRQRGASIAVGGFGHGRANLAALAAFPADRVKLHPSVFAAIDSCERTRLVVSSLVQMIHGLGCEAVAAGVERQEQLELLRAAGCDSVQGFFNSDPMPEDAFVTWVAAQDCARSLARAS
jgi:diguanylate cyclase (GGDEF)-like protein